MDYKIQLRQALQAPRSGEELLRTLHGFHAEGASQENVYEILTELLEEVRRDMGEAEEEILLDAMDVVCGWCGSHLLIWPDRLPKAHDSNEFTPEVFPV